MRNLVVLCALICGSVCAASAAEEGIASFFQYAGYSGLIAAHRTLPKGSQVRVVNLDNGLSVLVTIVDRGPFIHGRVIDVSPEAAVALGFRQAGLAHVRIDPISLEAPGSLPPLLDSLPPTSEQAAVPMPDEICKRDADRLQRLSSNPTSGEVAQLKRELGCAKLLPQVLALAQSSANAAPASAQARALTKSNIAPSPAKSASAVRPKWRAPTAANRTSWAAAGHRFLGETLLKLVGITRPLAR